MSDEKKHAFEFAAPAFKTDVTFWEWLSRERECRGHKSYAQTARDVGVSVDAVQAWARNRHPPRTQAMIIALSKWSGESIRLIRGMIEYEAATRDQKTIEIRDDSRVQPWRAVPQARQDAVGEWLESQIGFFEKQGGSLREFATTLRSAREELQKSAESSRNARKEVEIVRPSVVPGAES